MAQPIPFGNAKLGIDLLSDETALPDGALRDITNFDVDLVGELHTRPGAQRVGVQAGAHSLWSPIRNTFGLYAQGQQLRRLGADMSSTVLLDGLTPSRAMRYAELADAVFWTNGYEVGVVDARGARVLGVPVPDAPGLSQTAGSLVAGRYGVATSYVDRDGEEGGASAAQFIDVTQGGIALQLLPPPARAVALRVYLTPQNGDEFYRAAEIPAAMGATTVQAVPAGKLPAARFVVPMLPGSAIAAFSGRVFTAQGTRLVYSEAYAFGRHDPRFNWLDLGSPIRFLAAVGDGLYAGTPAGTVFVSGASPKDMGMRIVGPAPAAEGGAVVVPASHVGGQTDAPTVVWLGRTGFSIGGAGGAVRSSQEGRIRLAEHGPAQLCALTRRGIRQVVAVVPSTNPATNETATDSPY